MTGEVADAALTLGAVVLLPLAVAVAVFRYRLYDADRPLRRTVFWTIVSALLVGLYAGVVLAVESASGRSGHARRRRGQRPPRRGVCGPPDARIG